MRRTGRVTTTVAFATALMAAAVGCSQDDEKTAPELPGNFCWNAFSPEDVHSLLPVGESVKEDADPFRFSERTRFVSCLLYVDGNNGFHAWAKTEDDETFTERNTYESADPDPIPIGENGIVWNTGAATHISCRLPKHSGPSSGNYVRLSIELSGAVGQNERKALPGLLKQFTAFAQKELKCA